MRIGDSIFCELCLDRCTTKVKKLFRKEQEVTLKQYSTVVEHDEDGGTHDTHFCWKCMQLMQGAAAKILLKRAEGK